LTDFGLPGVRVFELKRISDERGFFCEALRRDWQEFLGNEWIEQINLSFSYPNVVRAWHKHNRGQVDYFLVLEGAMKICAYDDSRESKTKNHLAEIVASESRPRLVRIPGHYWHGTKTIGDRSSLTVYFVTKLYDYTNPDEERRAWNDPTVVPSCINGKKEDPRVGKPWDWFYPVHR